MYWNCKTEIRLRKKGQSKTAQMKMSEKVRETEKDKSNLNLKPYKVLEVTILC